MPSQNDIVWLALNAESMSKAEIDELDLSMLRSFEPRGVGYSVEMFKVGDCGFDEVGDKPSELVQAIYYAAQRMENRSFDSLGKVN